MVSRRDRFGAAGAVGGPLTGLAVSSGFDTFLLCADAPDQLARFAEEVVPATKASVAAERAR